MAHEGITIRKRQWCDPRINSDRYSTEETAHYNLFASNQWGKNAKIKTGLKNKKNFHNKRHNYDF